MAKRRFKIETAGTVLLWTDADNGRAVLRFDAADVAETLQRAVMVHGAKQIIGDAAAGSEDPIADMQRAIDSLRNGEWGTRATRLPDAAVFAAAVKAGRIGDSPEARAKWTGLKPAQRAAVAALPDVAAVLAAGEDGDSILESF